MLVYRGSRQQDLLQTGHLFSNAAHLRQQSLLKQPISFIQDEHLYPFKFLDQLGGLLNHLRQSSGSGHKDVRVLLQLLMLDTIVDASYHEGLS